MQPNENTPKCEERHPYVKRWWIVLFLIGCITFVLAMIGTVYNELTYSHGLQGIGTDLTLMVPLFIGIPSTLLSVVLALVCRPNRIWVCFSVMLLPAHILLFALNFWFGVIACC